MTCHSRQDKYEKVGEYSESSGMKGLWAMVYVKGGEAKKSQGEGVKQKVE